MGQILLEDKIGTLSHSTGVITLAASRLTIGGQQYVTSSLNRTISTDITMTANSLYMIYAIVSGGVVSLRISSNVNSVGPAGFTSWKLVGAFYANATPALGSFVNIEGVPESNSFSSNFTLGGLVYPFTVGNSTITSSVMRKGKLARVRFRIIMGNSGVVFNTLSLNIPVAFAIEGSVGGGENYNVFCKYYDQSSNTDYSGTLYDWGSNGLVFSQIITNATFATHQFTSASSPFLWTAGDECILDMTYPVIGWNNTPLKDL